MILWIEEVCGGLVAHCLDDGEASVGVRVAVDHVGPAFAGRTVDVRAEVREVAGRRITFAVRLVQDGREVMTGEHARAVVDLARFLGGRAGASDGGRTRGTVTFFFDVHSPWSYLASTRIAALARRHAMTVDWRPVHLANLIERIDGMRPMEQNRARVAWYRQDVIDRMAEAGPGLRSPSRLSAQAVPGAEGLRIRRPAGLRRRLRAGGHARLLGRTQGHLRSRRPAGHGGTRSAWDRDRSPRSSPTTPSSGP